MPPVRGPSCGPPPATPRPCCSPRAECGRRCCSPSMPRARPTRPPSTSTSPLTAVAPLSPRRTCSTPSSSPRFARRHRRCRCARYSTRLGWRCSNSGVTSPVVVAAARPFRFLDGGLPPSSMDQDRQDWVADRIGAKNLGWQVPSCEKGLVHNLVIPGASSRATPVPALALSHFDSGGREHLHIEWIQGLAHEVPTCRSTLGPGGSGVGQTTSFPLAPRMSAAYLAVVGTSLGCTGGG